MMDSDFSGLATFVLDTQLVEHQSQAIDRFLPDHLHTLASSAKRFMHRWNVADPAFSAEDAVQDALVELWRAAKNGKLAAIETAEGLVRLLIHKLKQEVLDEREREETLKRGGPKSYRDVADLEAIDSRTVSPEEQALGAETLEIWLMRLQKRDPVLRAIATKMSDGLSCREIAEGLGLPERAVEYDITVIKAILARRRCEKD
jgi:RNA polymerase sigma factor (sigma-70 family)